MRPRLHGERPVRGYRDPVALRSPRLTASDRARLALPAGDRALAAAELTDGRWAVASRLALHVLPADGGEAVRTPWCDVDRGSLEPTTRTLTVRWVWGGSSALAFTDGSSSTRFLQAFRERVQQSVVHAITVEVPGGRARVALRRDEDGHLFTQVLAEGPVDLANPAVAAAVDLAEGDVRSAVGLPR